MCIYWVPCARYHLRDWLNCLTTILNVKSNLFVLYLQKLSISEISSLLQVRKLISGRAGFKPRSIQTHFVSIRGAALMADWNLTFLLRIWVTMEAAGSWLSRWEPLQTSGWRTPMGVSTVSHCGMAHRVVQMVVLDRHNETQALGIWQLLLEYDNMIPV